MKIWLKSSKGAVALLFQLTIIYGIGTWCYGIEPTEDVQQYIVRAKQQFEKVRTVRFTEENTCQSTCDNPKFASNVAPTISRKKTILDIESHQLSIASFPTNGEEDPPGGWLFVNGINYSHLYNRDEMMPIILCPSLTPVLTDEKTKYSLKWFENESGWLFWGMLNDPSGFFSVWDILAKNGQISVERKEAGSKIVLRSSSPKESIEVELDLTRDCALSRFNYKNEANFARPSQPPRELQAPYRADAWFPLEEEYSVNEFGLFRGIYFPLSATFKASYVAGQLEIVKQGDGRMGAIAHSCKFHDVSEIKYSDVDMNFDIPANSLSFLFDVPNYTKVQVNDARQIQYVWIDGKVEPLVDALAEERLRKVKFIPGVAEPRFWMMFVGTLMVVLAVISLIWRYYTDKNGKGKGDDDNE